MVYWEAFDLEEKESLAKIIAASKHEAIYSIFYYWVYAI